MTTYLAGLSPATDADFVTRLYLTNALSGIGTTDHVHSAVAGQGGQFFMSPADLTRVGAYQWPAPNFDDLYFNRSSGGYNCGYIRCHDVSYFDINAGYESTLGGSVRINYYGYADGHTQFRTFGVYDGKGNEMISVGSAGLGSGTTMLHGRDGAGVRSSLWLDDQDIGMSASDGTHGLDVGWGVFLTRTATFLISAGTHSSIIWETIDPIPVGHVIFLWIEFGCTSGPSSLEPWSSSGCTVTQLNFFASNNAGTTTCSPAWTFGSGIPSDSGTLTLTDLGGGNVRLTVANAAPSYAAMRGTARITMSYPIDYP